MDKSGQDIFVLAVLDQILDVGQIDPSYVSPDYKLGAELNLSRVQIQSICFKAAKALSLPVSFESCRIEDLSARELVNFLKGLDRNRVRSAA